MTKINKNVAIVVIAVLSLIISVWVMSSINSAFGTSVTTAYVFIAWMMVNAGLIGYDKVVGLQ